MENQKIRTEARKAGVNLWELAEYFGVTDSTLSRKLRRELPEEKQKEYLAAIRELAAAKKRG